MMEKQDKNPLATLESLGFSYGKREILKDVSFSLEPGSFTVLMGPSGGGKSTLLYILGGFLRPTAGEYRFRGTKVYTLGEFGLGRFRRKNIGFLFQDFRLLPFLNAQKNISLPGFFTGKKIERNEREMIMRDLGIWERRKAKPAHLSGGEAQRTALGRALYLKPSLLLLDEPTGNLDLQTEKEILSLLLKKKEQGLTLFCVTHSKTLMKSADRVFTIKNKSLIESKRRGK